MPSIRTVNLVWERKIRGSYAVSRFALDDAGTVTLALPRPLEPRTYDLTRLATDGAAEVRATFSVETLIELEASAESDAVVGMTSDDLYLLHAGSKSRFLAERRIIFVDSALSIDGQTVVAGFSDVAGSSFALAVGSITGKVSWMREAEAPLSAVGVSSEGKFIAFGAETGRIHLLDASRREHWLFDQEEPVRYVACGPRGQIVAYGTAMGGVGLIDSEGSRRWEARVPGEVVSLSVSNDGGVCAVLTRPAVDDGTTRLFVLDSAGQTGWEYEADKRLLRLALSPSGQYLAASARDGTHTLYEIVFGSAGTSSGDAVSLAGVLQRTESCDDNGDWTGAVRALHEAIAERPAEVAACERLIEIQTVQTAKLLAEARSHADGENYSGALEALNRLMTIAPEEPELYALLHEVRELWTKREVDLSDARIDAGDFDDAGSILHAALAFAPLSLDVRRRLAALDVLRAESADAEAECLLKENRLEEGLAALERAQQAAASTARAAKIRRAQVEMEFAEGMAAYSEKRYREAIFQFKKVLARDPDHADARRHLNFAQRFELDSNEALNDRFGRIE